MELQNAAHSSFKETFECLMSCVGLKINILSECQPSCACSTRNQQLFSTELDRVLFSHISKNISLPFLGFKPALLKSQDYFFGCCSLFA